LPTGPTYTLEPGHPTPGLHNLLRPPIASDCGTGILTCFPSTTPFGLALGTDSPCADERCAGNLGLTASGLFTRFIATHVSIRTSDTSSNPYESPSQAYGTLSYRVNVPPKPSARGLSPESVLWTRRDKPSITVKRASAVVNRRATLRSLGLGGTFTPAISVHSLSPVESSAQDDSISELLRFL
jgi:hypothetical protein